MEVNVYKYTNIYMISKDVEYVTYIYIYIQHLHIQIQARFGGYLA